MKSLRLFCISSPWFSLARSRSAASNALLAMEVALFAVGTLAATAFATTTEVYTFDTAAGVAGSYGSANGTGSAARFIYPYGVAVDNGGNVYVADTYNHTIRKITNGQVTTVAGSAGSSGSTDGTGNVARFFYPYGIAVDAAGNLYITDTDNHTIRKITPAGVVSTLAGLAGASGSADGTGTAARFNHPNALAVDANGNVFVADTDNQTIRKITPTGAVTTFAGMPGVSGTADGTAKDARFYQPNGVAVDSAGNLYIGDTYNCTIRKVTPSGIVSTLAGSAHSAGSSDGVGAAARFNYPRGIAADSAGNLYVADEFNHTIRKITPTATVTTIGGLAGSSGSTDGQGSAARFNRVTGVAVSSSGVLYATDTLNHTIRRGTPSYVNVPAPLVDGVLDRSFNPGEFTNGQVNAAVFQADGKLIIGGYFNKVQGAVRHSLARLNVDGTLDPTFDPGDGPDYGIAIGGMLLQSDGKLLIYGGFFAFNRIPRKAAIARLNSDGSLDTAFDPGRGISDDGLDDGTGAATNPGVVTSVVLQSDGKLVVVGNFFYIVTAPATSTPRSSVARFNTDGTFDASYNPGAGVQAQGFPVYAGCQRLGANAGKVIVEGYFDSFDGHPVPGLARLNVDGSFDNTFNPEMGTLDPLFQTGLFVQSDDRIVVLYSIGSPASPIVIRLRENGARDSSFSVGLLDDYNSGALIYALAEQPDGKLLVGGFFHSLGGSVANSVVRLETNGAKDDTFDSAVAAGPSAYNVSALAVRPSDGHIFVGGYFSTYGGAPRNNMALTGPDGSLDNTFAGLSGATDYTPRIYALATQQDGKILVGGFFSSFNGAPHYNLVRLNADATIDPSFDSTFQSDGSVRAMFIQPDGKIVIAGNIRAINGIATGRLARLNIDGTVDTSFNPGTGADSTVYAITRDSAGNIFAGGQFQNFNGSARGRLAKLSPSGALDDRFDPGSGPSGPVFALGVAPDASGIFVGGSFSRYNETAMRNFVRVNATTAALDSSFNTGGFAFGGAVRAITPRADGKSYVGGSSFSLNGNITAPIVRLNVDGSRDTSFAAPTGGTTVYAVGVQGDKVVTGGVPAPSLELLRFTANGALDATFGSGADISITPLNFYFSVSPVITALAIQSDGKPLIGGIFNRYDGTPRFALARLTDPSLGFSAVSRKTHGAAGTFEIDLSASGTPAVECRSGGANSAYQIVFTFGRAVTVSGASITLGNAVVTSTSGSGSNTITVNLSGLANAQTVEVILAGVSSGTSTADIGLRMSVLVGDTNGDGLVNSGDAAQTRNRSGQTADPTNFRSDVNADGLINSGDSLAVRARSGSSIGAPSARTAQER